MTEYVQFNPEKNIIMVGLHRVRGFGESQMVDVAYTADKRKLKDGLDGESRHVKILIRSGTVKITLSEASISNGVFSGLDSGDVIVPIVVKDMTSLGTVFATQSAMLQKDPNLTRGNEPGDQEWIFQFTKGVKTNMGAKPATLGGLPL